MSLNWNIFTLQHSPADVARWLLIAGGLGTDPSLNLGGAPYYVPQGAWPIYNASEPNAPDNVVTLTDTTGHEFGRAQATGEMFRHPGVQVRVRAQDWNTGWLKAYAIRVALSMQFLSNLLSVNTITSNGSYTGAPVQYMVFSFNNISDVIPAGKDKPGSYRSIFTLNCNIVLRQVS